MMSPIKIVLIHFGGPNEPDKKINGSNLSEVLVREITIHFYEIYKLPELGERFMVSGGASSDWIFQCLRIESDKRFNSIEGYEYVIIANYVNRLRGFEKDEKEIARLKQFTNPHA